jgi:hypothetical protein
MWLQTRNRQNQTVFSHFHIEHLHEQQLRVEVDFPIEKTGSVADFLFLKLHFSHVMI